MYAQAEALYNQLLTIERRVLGAEHPNTLICMNNLADAYGFQGKYAQSEALFKQALETSRRVLGPRNPLTLAFLGESASMYQREGKYALAEVYGSEVLAARRRVLGPEHPDTMDSEVGLALPTSPKESSSKRSPSRAKRWRFSTKSSSMIGSASALRPSWARAWQDRSNTRNPNHCWSKAIKACWRVKTRSQPRTGIT